MRKIDTQVGSAIAGASAGVVLSPVIENLMPGTVPYIDTILPGNWAKNEVFYPLVIGGISLGAGILTNKEWSNFALGVGATATISAILKAVLTPPAARAFRRPRIVPGRLPRRLVARPPAQPSLTSQLVKPIVPEHTGVRSPPVRILA